jgi:Spy/CpxP family protein refolding chaperone
MKLSRHSALAALLAACVSASCATAVAAGQSGAPGGGQGAPGATDPRGERGPDHGRGHDFGVSGPGAPGPDAPPFHGLLGRLRYLNLSEAQQDKVFAITYAAAPRQREQEKAQRKAYEALRAIGGSTQFDEARADAAARDLGQAIANGALLRARLESQVLAVLTPEQREQLRKGRPPGPPGRP